MQTTAKSHLIHMSLEIASLQGTGEMFLGPMQMLSPLSVTEMTFNELELELILLKEVYDIFKGKGPDEAHSTMKTVIDMYAARMRDIENEIFERNVLV